MTLITWRAEACKIAPAEIATRPQQESFLIDPLGTPGRSFQRSIKSALWQRLLRLADRRAVTLPSDLARQPGHPLTMSDMERAIRWLEDAT
jgi:hypothetical protein